jgi:hypothetical protein
MNEVTRRNIRKSFFISLAYVGLGTVSVLPLLQNTFLDGDWRVFATLLTLPVNFFSVAIMISDSKAIGLVLVVQLIYFLLFWLILYGIMRRRSRKKNITPAGLKPL